MTASPMPAAVLPVRRIFARTFIFDKPDFLSYRLSMPPELEWRRRSQASIQLATAR